MGGRAGNRGRGSSRPGGRGGGGGNAGPPGGRAAPRLRAAGGGSSSGCVKRGSALRRCRFRPAAGMKVVHHPGPQPVVERLLDNVQVDDEQRHHRASARRAVRSQGGREAGSDAAPLEEELGAVYGPHPRARVVLIEAQEKEAPVALRLVDGATIPVAAAEEEVEDFPVPQQRELRGGLRAQGPDARLLSPHETIQSRPCTF